jgi:signal peptidase I
MDQTLFAGDHILVTKTAYGLKVPFADRFLVRFQAPNRGDIIVFKFPEDERKDFVKRVIGLPGDVVEIRDKRLFLNGKEVPESYVQHVDAKDDVEKRDQFGPVQVPDGSYFVLGDNRDQSLDSRFWGFVSIEKIKGKVFLVYWSWDRNERMVRWDRIGLSR